MLLVECPSCGCVYKDAGDGVCSNCGWFPYQGDFRPFLVYAARLCGILSVLLAAVRRLPNE